MAATGAPPSCWPLLLALLLSATVAGQPGSSVNNEASAREGQQDRRAMPPAQHTAGVVRGEEEGWKWAPQPPAASGGSTTTGASAAAAEHTLAEPETANWKGAQSQPWHATQHVMRLPPSGSTSVDHNTHITAELMAAAADGSGFPDLPRLVAVAAARLEANSPCGRDSAAFLAALSNFTLWAVQMYDASVKAPSGVLSGSVYEMGHFDECVAVRTEHVRAQYCLPEVHLEPVHPQPLPKVPHSLEFPPEDSAWTKLQFAGDRTKIRRDVWWWALCVPASCSARQVHGSLAAVLHVVGQRTGTLLRADLSDEYCTLGDRPPAHAATVLFTCVVAVLIVFAVVGSYYDARLGADDIFNTEKGKGVARLIAECFSVQRNYRNLMQVKQRNVHLDIFGFLRTSFLMSIMAGHRLLIYAGHPLYNGETEDQLFRHPSSMLVGNGVILVDIFFTIGGITLVRILFQEFDKGLRFYQLFFAILNRYMRLTPLYVVMILFQCGVLPYLGSGPLWKPIIIREQTRCETTWWANLLYINNYISISNICMFQSWYLSADFHFFITSLFLCYVIWRWPVVGWTAMGTLTLMSMVLPFSTIYFQNLDALVMPFPRILKNFREDKVFQKLYVQSHNRASSYFVGVIGAILLRQAKNLPKFSKVATYTTFLFGYVGGVAIMVAAYVFFVPGKPYNVLENAVYGGLHHAAIAVLVNLHSLLGYVGSSESLTNFLSAKVFIILGRLSFAAYLVHTVPQMYHLGIRRQPGNFDVFNLVTEIIADFVYTYSFAVPLTVLIESPFRRLMKVLLQRGK